MNNTDLVFVSNLLQAVLLAILPVLAALAVRWLWKTTSVEAGKLDQQTLMTLRWLADMAVQAAEQAKLSGYIADKKQYALEFCAKWLASRGLTIDLVLINVAIEAAVMEIFNKEKPALKLKQTSSGQGMVEYALILVLVSVLVISALTILGPMVGNVFLTINSSL
jgi:pilus assembly protein Flp/PilA